MFIMDNIILILWLIILTPFAIMGYKLYKASKSLSASKHDENALRMEKTRLKGRFLSFLAVFMGLMALIVFLLMGSSFETALVAGIVVYGLFYLWARNVKNAYNQDFKENFVTAELSKTFDNLKYEPKKVLDKEHIAKLNLFRQVDRVNGNDLISATYKGLSFAQSDLYLEEVHITRMEDEDGHTYENETNSPVFRGRVMRFDFDTPFRGVVQVVRRDFNSANVFFNSGNWKKIETELADFSDIFEVYALDELDAMNVMTPQMIEGIHYLNQKLNVPMAFEFEGKNMYAFMALGRDSFDVSGKKTVLEEKELLQQDMELVTGFLDTMYFKGHTPSNENPADADASAGIGAGVRTDTQTKSGFFGIPFLGRTQRIGMELQSHFRLICNLSIWLPLTLWLVLSIYAIIMLPDGIALSFKTEGDSIYLEEFFNTWIFVLIGAVFIVPACLVSGMTLEEGLKNFFLGRGMGLSGTERIGKFIKSLVIAFLWAIPLLMDYMFITINL